MPVPPQNAHTGFGEWTCAPLRGFCCSDRCGLWPFVTIGVLAQDTYRCRSLVISIQSRRSLRALANQRSVIAFARGACTWVLTIRTPPVVNTASNAAVSLASRSWMSNFMTAPVFAHRFAAHALVLNDLGRHGQP